VDKGIQFATKYMASFTTFTAHHVHRLLSSNFYACKANLGRDNNAHIRSLHIEMRLASSLKIKLMKLSFSV
jgi:hypothetical protein